MKISYYHILSLRSLSVYVIFWMNIMMATVSDCLKLDLRVNMRLTWLKAQSHISVGIWQKLHEPDSP